MTHTLALALLALPMRDSATAEVQVSVYIIPTTTVALVKVDGIVIADATVAHAEGVDIYHRAFVHDGTMILARADGLHASEIEVARR